MTVDYDEIRSQLPEWEPLLDQDTFSEDAPQTAPVKTQAEVRMLGEPRPLREEPVLARAARVQNESAPEKLLNRYEKRFEKREKGSEKRSETRLKNV